ncbi:MAG TPA: hypothetical protein HA257_04520 [Candidatus Methanoperedenaceae archaeon]|nr:hypothetical protein [Candidatus Methanoperedenaceae archaeon]
MRWVCLLLVLFLAQSATAIELDEGVRIPIVAVSGPDGGPEEGALLEAVVLVTNGTGHVFVDTRPYTQVDLQGSARIAAMVASDVMEVDQRNYDFYYIIDVPSPIIGGPSAGGALTVATIAAMNNWTLKGDIVMTGTINPDESIGPVGGIPSKLQAAAAGNTTTFLLPEGQRTVLGTKTVRSKGWPYTFIEQEQTTIDLVDMGRDLGVNVKEVGNVREAVSEFTGRELAKPSLRGAVVTVEYQNKLRPLAVKLQNESQMMYRDAEKVAPGSLGRASELIQRARTLYGEKKYYAATSVYFQSMIELRSIIWSAGYDSSKDRQQYMSNLTDEVGRTINDTELMIADFKAKGYGDVSSTGAAESRITEAGSMLKEGMNKSEITDYISLMAQANERARSARWWLSLADPGAPVVDEETLADRAGYYLSQAQSIVTYSESLLLESGDVHVITGADEHISRARIQMKKHYYTGAIYDSLRAIVAASTAIALMGEPDEEKKIRYSKEAAGIAIGNARNSGTEPTLAVSSYEFAETSPANTFQKVEEYGYAKMLANIMTMLNEHGRTPVINESATAVPTQPAAAEEVSVPGEGAPFAIAAILLVILMRRR